MSYLQQNKQRHENATSKPSHTSRNPHSSNSSIVSTKTINKSAVALPCDRIRDSDNTSLNKPSSTASVVSETSNSTSQSTHMNNDDKNQKLLRKATASRLQVKARALALQAQKSELDRIETLRLRRISMGLEVVVKDSKKRDSGSGSVGGGSSVVSGGSISSGVRRAMKRDGITSLSSRKSPQLPLPLHLPTANGNSDRESYNVPQGTLIPQTELNLNSSSRLPLQSQAQVHDDDVSCMTDEYGIISERISINRHHGVIPEEINEDYNDDDENNDKNDGGDDEYENDSMCESSGGEDDSFDFKIEEQIARAGYVTKKPVLQNSQTSPRKKGNKNSPRNDSNHQTHANKGDGGDGEDSEDEIPLSQTLQDHEMLRFLRKEIGSQNDDGGEGVSHDVSEGLSHIQSQSQGQGQGQGFGDEIVEDDVDREKAERSEQRQANKKERKKKKERLGRGFMSPQMAGIASLPPSATNGFATGYANKNNIMSYNNQNQMQMNTPPPPQPSSKGYGHSGTSVVSHSPSISSNISHNTSSNSKAQQNQNLMQMPQQKPISHPSRWGLGIESDEDKAKRELREKKIAYANKMKDVNRVRFIKQQRKLGVRVGAGGGGRDDDVSIQSENASQRHESIPISMPMTPPVQMKRIARPTLYGKTNTSTNEESSKPSIAPPPPPFVIDFGLTVRAPKNKNGDGSGSGMGSSGLGSTMDEERLRMSLGRLEFRLEEKRARLSILDNAKSKHKDKIKNKDKIKVKFTNNKAKIKEGEEDEDGNNENINRNNLISNVEELEFVPRDIVIDARNGGHAMAKGEGFDLLVTPKYR